MFPQGRDNGAPLGLLDRLSELFTSKGGNMALGPAILFNYEKVSLCLVDIII